MAMTISWAILGHIFIYRTESIIQHINITHPHPFCQTISSDLSLEHSTGRACWCTCEELGLSVHSDNGELVVVTLTGEREVQVGTKQAAGKMKAGYWRRCGSYSVVATDNVCVS